MNAGKLDQRVAIYRAGPDTDDGYTDLPGTMALFATRWCHVVPQSGKEVIEAEGKDGQRLSRFRFRWDSVTATLSETDQLDHDGTRYAITGPMIEIGRREGVEVVAASVGDV